jgi:eukaryotic-like serine/threonine-protein kinase
VVGFIFADGIFLFMINMIGTRLGNYEIVQRFGEGGMAAVYKARQTNIKRDVAVKVILPNLASREEFTKRFEREAETSAGLSHPHIVKVFDYGSVKGFHLRLMEGSQGIDPRKEVYYLVMELLTGGSLEQKLRGGPMPVNQILPIVHQVASALDYAHGKGVIHRDLKPPNILFDAQGNAFLTDFGIAKMLVDTAPITQEGMTMGTPFYMPPEQWESENMGPGVDIYALGIVLFEMLTGKLPFTGSTPYKVLHAHMTTPPPSLYSLAPNLPPGLDPVIFRVLAKRPEDRYQNATDFAKAFSEALGGTGGGMASVLPTNPEDSVVSKRKAPEARPKVASEAAAANDPLMGGVSLGLGGKPGTAKPDAKMLLLLGGILLVLVVIAVLLLTRGG